jgi:tetratricopeptide (TPR) repeat protein
MRALLDALERGPLLSPARVAIGLSVAVLGGLLVLGARARDSAGRICSGAEAAWGGIWSDAEREGSRALLLAGRPELASTFERFDATLQTYRRGWLAMRTDACEATNVRHEQSEALLDLRFACLDDRRREAEQIVKVLQQPDAPPLERSAQAARELPDLQSCARTVALTAVLPPPTEPAARTELSSLSEELARAKAQFLVGEHAKALAVVRPAVARARALGYLPLLGRLLLIEHSTLARLGQETASEQIAWETAAVAAQARDDATLTELWIDMGFQAGERRQWELANDYYRLSDAFRNRMGGDDLLEVNVLIKRGYLAGYQERWEEQEALYRQALAILTRLGRLETWEAGEVYDALADVHEGEGRLEEALADCQRTVALREKIFEPTARDIGGALLDQPALRRDPARHPRSGDSAKGHGNAVRRRRGAAAGERLPGRWANQRSAGARRARHRRRGGPGGPR